MGKTVDTGDDFSSIFAQTVEDHAQRFFTGFVGTLGKSDCAFGSSKGFVTGTESKAFGLFITVANAIPPCFSGIIKIRFKMIFTQIAARELINGSFIILRA